MHESPIAMQERAAVDWKELHRRLEGVRSALESGASRSPADTRRILRGRARALARKEEAAVPGSHLDLLGFVLANERYAVESACVQEVRSLKALTAVPSTPPFVAGVVNVRGELVWVMDLRKLLDLPGKNLPEPRKLIILEAAGTRLGILADAVAGVRRVPGREIQPAPPTLADTRAEYLLGVTKDRTVILHAERILTDRNGAARQKAQMKEVRSIQRINS